jgi:hypothetical protein
MDNFPAGKWVRGYLASSDISTAAAVSLFDADGNAVTQTVGTRLIITSLEIRNGATASIITLFADTDGDGALDSGEELWSGSLAVNGGLEMSFLDGLASRKLAASNVNRLMAVASAASVGTRINLVGRIINT